MREKLKEIYENVKAQKPCSLELEIDDKKYIRKFRPAERLILLGAGHIAQPVCRYANDLGFSVTVADDRPAFANYERFPEASAVICDDFQNAIEKLDINENDYVAVITRGHRYDADCLRSILKGKYPKYLGMIGSKRRVIALMDLLEEEGFERCILDKIFSPIGLDINALTVKEIAVSIAAQLIQCRRSDIKRHSTEKVMISEDIDSQLLEYLACDDTPKSLLVVYESSGSTPAKSGAMMAVDKNNRTVGTIGGGCAESSILRDAFYLIGTGKSKTVKVNMSNDVAEEEGMVCGGSIKVIIIDVN